MSALVCVQFSTVMRLPWSGTIEGEANSKLLVPSILLRSTCIPGYQDILVDCTMWLSWCSYSNVRPVSGGEHVARTDVNNTNAKFSGISDFFGRAVCEVSSRASYNAERTHTAVKLNNMPVSCRHVVIRNSESHREMWHVHTKQWRSAGTATGRTWAAASGIPASSYHATKRMVKDLSMVKYDKRTLLMSSQRMFKLRSKTRLVMVDERDEKERDMERQLRAASETLRIVRAPACALISISAGPICLQSAAPSREDASGPRSRGGRNSNHERWLFCEKQRGTATGPECYLSMSAVPSSQR
jgi:hypothetical protein